MLYVWVGGAQPRSRPRNHSGRFVICRHYQQTARCSYGEKCSFAHGEQELQVRNGPQTPNITRFHSLECEALPLPIPSDDDRMPGCSQAWNDSAWNGGAKQKSFQQQQQQQQQQQDPSMMQDPMDPSMMQYPYMAEEDLQAWNTWNGERALSSEPRFHYESTHPASFCCCCCCCCCSSSSSCCCKSSSCSFSSFKELRCDSFGWFQEVRPVTVFQ